MNPVLAQLAGGGPGDGDGWAAAADDVDEGVVAEDPPEHAITLRSCGGIGGRGGAASSSHPEEEEEEEDASRGARSTRGSGGGGDRLSAFPRQAHAKSAAAAAN
jgi:hypothetical protein